MLFSMIKIKIVKNINIYSAEVNIKNLNFENFMIIPKDKEHVVVK